MSRLQEVHNMVDRELFKREPWHMVRVHENQGHGDFRETGITPPTESGVWVISPDMVGECGGLRDYELVAEWDFYLYDTKGRLWQCQTGDKLYQHKKYHDLVVVRRYISVRG